MEVQVLAQQRHLWTYFRIKCGTEGNFIAFGWIHLNFRFTWLAAELETPTGRALPEWGAEWFIRTAEVPAGGRAEDFFTIEESPNRGSKGGSNPQKWLPILSSFFFLDSLDRNLCGLLASRLNGVRDRIFDFHWILSANFYFYCNVVEWILRRLSRSSVERLIDDS